MDRPGVVDADRTDRIDAPRVAVVGAGPAGWYAAQALVVRHPGVEVTVLERLPVPHGLVRHGVAPDHWTVRSKAEWFDRVLAHPRVHLRANVAVGTDVTMPELRAQHHAVVHAWGADRSRPLGIPGEDLPGSLAASDYVGWYTGHPDHADLDPPLDSPAVAVVGMGNVALDVVRSLAKDPDELARTAMAGHAVTALRGSRVTDVHVLGRRGASQTSFTPKELREVAELPGVQLVIDPAALAADRPPPAGVDAAERARAARVVELLRTFGAAQPDPDVRVRVHLHLLVRPTAVRGSGRVEGVTCERNRLELRDGRWHPVGTGETLDLPVGLLLRAVGYRSSPVPGVVFDDRRGIVPSVGGRVLDADGRVRPGEYACGWVRRGPSGVIGTNKADAEQVVGHLLADLPGLEAPDRAAGDALDALLAERGVAVVDADGWERIRRAERREGSRHGRRAEPFMRVEDMLAAAGTGGP